MVCIRKSFTACMPSFFFSLRKNRHQQQPPLLPILLILSMSFQGAATRCVYTGQVPGSDLRAHQRMTPPTSLPISGGFRLITAVHCFLGEMWAHTTCTHCILEYVSLITHTNSLLGISATTSTLGIFLRYILSELKIP